MALVHKTTSYANANLEALKDYGLSDEILKSYTASGEGYEEYLAKPDAIKAEKKTATDEMAEWFKQLNTEFTEFLDNHMMQYKSSQAQFYSDYENARNIYDNPTHALSVKGLVVDGHEPTHILQHAKVTAKFKAGAAFKEMHSTTSEKGNYQFKGIPDGKCTVTFELEYYDTLIKEIAVYGNKATQLDVEMTKTV